LLKKTVFNEAVVANPATLTVKKSSYTNFQKDNDRKGSPQTNAAEPYTTR